MKSKGSKSNHNIQHSDSLNFPSLPGQITGSKSNDSMNIRLTANDDDNNNKSIDFDIDNDDIKQISEQKRSSGINRISQKFNTRRTRKEKTRYIIATEPNDNYLKLNWIQRFQIFDRCCDSIEKLLRIDSYGKFRESAEYLMFCDQLRKKSISTTNLILNKTSNKLGTMIRPLRKHVSIGNSDEIRTVEMHKNNISNTSSAGR